ncbi:ABC transporter ATP-binding protein [Methylomonas methanica]|uniref:Xenobiotic-transporting ATPase n=1 Tax=Methylomonas methanica (strain DSM 25384 / MC09) TaxID=857087 RepID=F9ZWB7_METMM|nr:ABC transporter ATP-binding protein [Methylomonas methanica]AEF99586.1 Xenobiotic-transporting ATPase [Methylomonas methanica MC09]
MQQTQSIYQLLNRLWHHITPRRRWQFGLLLLLTLLASFSEIFSIGAVLPFLGMLTTPERVFEHALMQPVIKVLDLTMPEQLLLPLTLVFGGAVLIAGFLRLLLLWASTRLSFASGADLSLSIYRRTLYQPYAVHCGRNSSEVIGGISGKANSVIYSIILPFLMLVSAGVMLIAILVTLLSVEPIIALVAFGGLGLIYILIIRLTRKKLLSDSQCIARESVQVIKSLQEGLGGIRDVLIDGSQATYCQIYRSADLPLRRAQGNSAFISASPRYGMEALGMLLIIALAYSLAREPDGISKAIPVLGALALGAQRLLPVLQQAYSSWSAIQSGQAALQDALDLLDQPLPDYADRPPAQPLPLERAICLKDLGFRYSAQTPYILMHINLTIPKGSRVGFIGTTGSGKSTLLDIVMGLLQPTEGALLIDGYPVTSADNRTWQAHIAHVPQAIFLADSTIEENIAFGVPKGQIDSKRVRLAAKQAQIADSIESWPKQYQTFVGERGVRLSGGQRQRIGIARALYKQADVIIFDEATSALDSETEQAVMQAIEGLSKDLTLLIIAHRLTTLKNCTQIVELADGGIKRVESYQDIVKQS